MPTADPQLTAAIAALTLPDGASDADVLALVNAPRVVPRDYRITWTSLGDILGPSGAIGITAALKAMAASPDAATSAQATYVMGVLGGTGIDPANPMAHEMMQQFVGAGVLTEQQATDVLNYTYYPAGYVRTLADVTAARVAIARTAALDAVRAGWADRYNRGVGLIDDAGRGDGPVPSVADVAAGVA